ncbi:MAG: hypothetical protein QXU81_10455 [Candidatus Bathyarchaeia archaeon]
MTNLDLIKEKEAEFPKSALTWRSFLILLFVALLLAPMDTFLQISFYSRFLSSGPGYIVGMPALWVTIILFTEIARILGKSLTRHEIFLIYALFGTAMTETFFIDILFQSYSKSHPITASFIDPRTKAPLSQILPAWYAPPLGSPAYALNSFLHPDWALPILVFILSIAFGLCVELGLGLLCSYLYVEVERLPYPTVALGSESIITIAERDPTRMKLFTISALVSLIWSTVSFGVPTTLGAAFGIRAGILTFADLTTLIDKILPGAVFGFTFEPFPYTFAWLLPTSTIVSIVIGSFTIWIIGNSLALRIPSPLFLQFQREYVIGSPATFVMWRAQLHIWLSFFIGAALGLAISRLIMGWKYLFSGIRSLLRARKTSEAAGYPSVKVIFALWFSGLIGLIVLLHLLVPQFPLWTLLLFVVILPFITAMINARGMGETGFGVSIPYMKELAIIISGYTGAEVWFMPLYIRNFGTGAFASDLSYTAKVCQILGTRFTDYIKSFLILFPITILMSFAIISYFWIIAPIPSFAYPATINNWPELVVEQNFMATNFFTLFKPEFAFWAFILLAVITTTTNWVRIPYFNPIALVAGFTTPPWIATAFIIGHIIGTQVFEKKLGKEWWHKYRAVLLAGIACGYGIVATLAGVIAIISKTLWYTPKPY